MRPLGALPWDSLAEALSREGFVVLRGAFDAAVVKQLSALVSGETSRCPLGDEVMPAPLAAWRAELYRWLAPVANEWNERLGLAPSFPPRWPAFREQNLAAGQRRPLCFVERLAAQAHRPLRQDAEGAQVFPVQVVGLLSAPGAAFTGGEFVMTEQRPRMQSRPMVVPLGLGDGALFATARRPIQGKQGVQAVTTRHAVSRVRGGERLDVTLSFHAASGDGSA